VIVWVSGLGNFGSASLLKIDATTSAATGPATAVSVTPTAEMTVKLSGYGVAWLMLKP
jgi:hypothetical protein